MAWVATVFERELAKNWSTMSVRTGPRDTSEFMDYQARLY